MPKYMIKSGPHYKRSTSGKKWTRYAKGDVIELSELEAKNIMDKLDPIGPPDPIEPDAPPKQVLKAVHKGGGKYDVVNEESGKTINSKLLTKKEALELLDNS